VKVAKRAIFQKKITNIFFNLQGVAKEFLGEGVPPTHTNIIDAYAIEPFKS